jgi:hypothetical protein
VLFNGRGVYGATDGATVEPSRQSIRMNAVSAADWEVMIEHVIKLWQQNERPTSVGLFVGGVQALALDSGCMLAAATSIPARVSCGQMFWASCPLGPWTSS